MRWFGRGRRAVPQDPATQEALLGDVRHRFGGHVGVPFAEQAGAVTGLLAGDDGLVVAARILREVADSAYAELVAQAGPGVDRRNYQPLWRAAGPRLRWPLFALPCGFHPYIQVTAAVAVTGEQAKRVVRVLDPDPLLSDVFEVLDLTVAGWEHGRVRVDADAATLAGRLVATARDLRAAMSEPPPLPPPVRELMRRNHTVDVLDQAGGRVIGGFNPGRTMREALLA